MVVCNIRPSISAGYKAFAKQIGVSKVAFYSKINGIEPQVSQALVRFSSEQLAPIIAEMGGKQPEILPGYLIKIIDGNSLAATEHRLSVLREVARTDISSFSVNHQQPELSENLLRYGHSKDKRPHLLQYRQLSKQKF